MRFFLILLFFTVFSLNCFAAPSSLKTVMYDTSKLTYPNDIILRGQSLSISNAPGSVSYVSMPETNRTFSTYLQAAHRMTRSVTNIIGLYEIPTASTIVIDANQNHQVNVTNRLSGNVVIVLTNAAPGQILRGRLLGATSGGPYTAEFVVHAGHWAANGSEFAAMTTSITKTVTNNTSLEWNDEVSSLLGTSNVNTFLFNYTTF